MYFYVYWIPCSLKTRNLWYSWEPFLLEYLWFIEYLWFVKNLWFTCEPLMCLRSFYLPENWFIYVWCVFSPQASALVPLVSPLCDHVSAMSKTNPTAISEETYLNAQTALVSLRLLCKNIGFQHKESFIQVNMCILFSMMLLYVCREIFQWALWNLYLAVSTFCLFCMW